MRFSIFRQFANAITSFTLLLSMSVPAFGGQLKVATVNMAKLLNEFHENKAAEAEERVDVEDIKKADESRVEVIQGIMGELQKLQKEFNDPSISPDKRKAISEVANKKQAAMAALQKDREEVLNRRRRELSQKIAGLINDIRTKVNAAVDAHAATLDVDLVFDNSGLTTSQVPFLLYARTKIDLTDAVLEKLNKDAPPAFKESAKGGSSK